MQMIDTGIFDIGTDAPLRITHKPACHLPLLRKAGRPPMDFSGVDWSQFPTLQSAADHFGCSTTTILNAQRAVGYQKTFVKDLPPDQAEAIRRQKRDNDPLWQAWQKIDWTTRDIRIAEEMGVTRERVRQIRKALGVPQNPRGLDIKWKSLDWANLTDKQIAKATKATVQTIKGYRHKFAPETTPFRQKRARMASTLNSIPETAWRTLTRTQIATRYKINKGRLLRYLKLHPELHKPSRWNSAARYKGIKWKSMSNQEIADIVGVKKEAVWQYRNRLHPETVVPRPKTTKYSNVDWAKSDKELGRLFNKKPACIAQIRYRLGTQRSKFGYTGIGARKF